MRSQRLIIATSVRAHRYPDGKIALPEAFLSGLEEYRKYWRGSMRVIMEPATTDTDHRERVLVEQSQLPFEFLILSYSSAEMRKYLTDSALVVCDLECARNSLDLWCKMISVPIIYATELTLGARLQIARQEIRAPAKLTRRVMWELTTEREYRKMAKMAAAMQCNGTPAYNAYRSLNRNTFLFFDSRIRTQDLISQNQLTRRLGRMRKWPIRPLKLAYIGSLTDGDGAAYISRFVEHVCSLNIPFELNICKQGPGLRKLQDEVYSRGFGHCVDFRKDLEDKQRLLHFLKDCDLLISPKLDDEPTAQYLEGMSCGLPVIGFGNQVLQGIMACVKGGWVVPTRHAEGLANVIMRLHTCRGELSDVSKNALSFASEHTFEETFRKRVEHFYSVLGYSMSYLERIEGLGVMMKDEGIQQQSYDRMQNGLSELRLS